MDAEPPALLGVGLSYTAGLEPILREHADLVDVLEVEPQTLWVPQPGIASGYRVDTNRLERIAGCGIPTLVHGIGNPVGGSVPPDRAQAELFAETAAFLEAPWASEHLSFNRAASEDGCLFAGFMLPPLQTPAGVAAAARSVRALAEVLDRPLAVETGVNYLQPRPWELDDGAFVGAVAAEADCGILLDLHNLWTNERNGRQPVAEFVEQLPLDRVWEVHLAGGSERGGFWLDSHAGGVPEPLLALTRELVPDLPALGAIIFELFPVNLPSFGLDGVRQQLEALHELWAARGARSAGTRAVREEEGRTPPIEAGGAPDPAGWERALVGAVLGEPAGGGLQADLADEPGAGVVAELIGEFRSAMVVQNLPLTSRLLFLTVGEAGFLRLLGEHWREVGPGQFAVTEAQGFAGHLAERGLDVPYLDEILRFEQGVLATLLDERLRVVPFAYDPLPLLRALADGRLPGECVAGSFEVELTPDDVPQGWTLDNAARTAVAWHH